MDKQILVIDDSDTFLSVTETAYKTEDITVVGVKGIKGAKRFLIENVPNVILASIALRGAPEAGITFCDELQNHPELSKIPIVLVASELNDGFIRKSSESGAQGLIAWPVTVQVLKARLAGFLSTEKGEEKVKSEVKPKKKNKKVELDPEPGEESLKVEVEVSDDSEERRLKSAQLLLAKVLHKIQTENLVADISLSEVPELVVNTAEKICRGEKD